MILTTTGKCTEAPGGPVVGRHPQRALCKSLGMFSRCDPSSPYIHPVGWCHEHGKPLTPPQGESVVSQVQPGSASPWEHFPGWRGDPGGTNLLPRLLYTCSGAAWCLCWPSLHSEMRGGPQLSVHTWLFLLPCTVGFTVHEKITALLGVSQVPVCLAQTWLALEGSGAFWGTF